MAETDTQLGIREKTVETYLIKPRENSEVRVTGSIRSDTFFGPKGARGEQALQKIDAQAAALWKGTLDKLIDFISSPEFEKLLRDNPGVRDSLRLQDGQKLQVALDLHFARKFCPIQEAQKYREVARLGKRGIDLLIDVLIGIANQPAPKPQVIEREKVVTNTVPGPECQPLVAHATNLEAPPPIPGMPEMPTPVASQRYDRTPSPETAPEKPLELTVYHMKTGSSRIIPIPIPIVREIIKCVIPSCYPE